MTDKRTPSSTTSVEQVEKTAGYMVLIRHPLGHYEADWDGELYATAEGCRDAVREAQAGGFATAELARLVVMRDE